MFSVKKTWQLQLQVSNICHINNMFRTHSLSLMYCVNLAETSHTSVYTSYKLVESQTTWRTCIQSLQLICSILCINVSEFNVNTS